MISSPAPTAPSPLLLATTSEVDEGFEAAETVDKAQYDRDVLP